MMVITKRLIITLLKTFPSITTIKNQVRKMMSLLRCLLEEKAAHLVKTLIKAFKSIIYSKAKI